MSKDESSSPRTVLLTADREPFFVVFEMLGHTVIVEPFESLRLVTAGPGAAQLTIGYGANGVSVFRDENLHVDVYDHNGALLSVPGW